MNTVTHILDSVRKGEPVEPATLLPLVYGELRRLAASKMAKEAPGQTIQATALVHEAWLRLAGQDGSAPKGRNHFFAAAAEAMRRILIERARRKKSLKRGAGEIHVELEEVEIPASAPEDEIIAVHEALDKLAIENPSLAELVKLRFFVGFSNKECGEILGLSEPTIERRWGYARAWLFREIRSNR